MRNLVQLSRREMEFVIWCCNQELSLDTNDGMIRVCTRLRNKLEKICGPKFKQFNVLRGE